MKDENRRAREKLIRMLSRKHYFSYEIQEKLLKQGLPIEAVEAALQLGKKLGLIDDERYRQQFIEQQARKGFGPRAIAYKLKLKKQSAHVEIEQSEAIRKLLGTTKYRNKTREQQIVALQRRGFDLDQIFSTLNEVE
jgi:SOS response regulatory protein OraA/RecX